MYDFSEKIVVVTGAAQGLGAAIAKQFLQNNAKAVAMLDLKRETLEEAAAQLDPEGSRAVPIVCNVADRCSVEQAFKIIAERLGPVDILVNNAGITRDTLAHRMTAEQFDPVVQVSLYGAFYCIRQVIGGMRERGYGRIISMSSLASRGNIGQANYSAAKAGVIGLTKTLSMELGPKNITVNCVAPGMINTDIIRTVPEKTLAGMVSAIPLRRVGEPEEVADLVTFLASDRASYISGQCIKITGGWF